MMYNRSFVTYYDITRGMMEHKVLGVFRVLEVFKATKVDEDIKVTKEGALVPL